MSSSSVDLSMLPILKMALFDSASGFQKVPVNMRLTNGLHQPVFDFFFDGSDVSMEVKGLVVCSSRPRGWGVNRLSAAQESFHQDRECNPMEILESSEARYGE